MGTWCGTRQREGSGQLLLSNLTGRVWIAACNIEFSLVTLNSRMQGYIPMLLEPLSVNWPWLAAGKGARKFSGEAMVGCSD